MTAPTLDPTQAAALKARAERLTARAQGLTRVDGVVLWGVPLWVCKAFVWAQHRRADPVEACLVAHYGRDLGHGPSALRHASAMAQRLAQLSADPI